MKRRRLANSLEFNSKQSNDQEIPRRPADHHNSSNPEGSPGSAPTRHVPESGGQRVEKKSKYEASEPFRPKKGDRFS